MDSRETAEHIENLYKELLGILTAEKYKDSNHKFAREIAVTITSTEQALAYFKTFVQPNLEEK